MEIRKEREMRQEDLAKELIISRQEAAKIEDPRNSSKMSTLIGYALAVGAGLTSRSTRTTPILAAPRTTPSALAPA
ncbi:hypothetical protein QP858_04885 [Trueperella bernardiae]|uniref:HTH cro/C1-type domain-containing protein n=1 Tax=Trueperella bernardiae TaxID=59561 RepID=A0AAW6ZKC4_9ACTO|nr:helix-turn-helix transcriptional regulator [Trueperella bernardiae]MDK8601798.1 hypothetical protein [Trueperella bernardiae]